MDIDKALFLYPKVTGDLSGFTQERSEMLTSLFFSLLVFYVKLYCRDVSTGRLQEVRNPFGSCTGLGVISMLLWNQF